MSTHTEKMEMNEQPGEKSPLVFYREAYEKTRAYAEALEKSNTRLYEQEALHTESYGIVCAERDRAVKALSDSVKEADANAPWMTEAHMLCSDHGIPHGLLTERIRALRRQLEDEGIQSEAALAAQAARENDLMKYAEKFARGLVDTNTGRFQVDNGDGTTSPGDYSCIFCDARGPAEPLQHKADCTVGEAATYLAALSKNTAEAE